MKKNAHTVADEKSGNNGRLTPALELLQVTCSDKLLSR